MRPRLLDLFCGAGGASAGYARAGFEIVGVDNDPDALAEYPYPCVLADAMDVLAGRPLDSEALLPPTRGVQLDAEGRLPLGQFDVIHASPPCQEYSITRNDHERSYPRLVEPLLAWFAERWEPRLWIIENVPGAPLPEPVLLCGSEWPLAAIDEDGRDLRLRRHRLFSSNAPLHRLGSCSCAEDRRLGRIGGVYGGGSPDRAADNPRKNRGGYTPALPVRAALMGIDWMTTDALSEAIPPAYTEHLGGQILAALAEQSAPELVLEEPALFEIEAPPPTTLAEKFGVPPMSVINRREGWWRDRKRAWLRLGIRSEIGRGAEQEEATGAHQAVAAGITAHVRSDPFAELLRARMEESLWSGVSIFDPVVCELAYRWFSAPGDAVLDPFAGGSVRGIVASHLGRGYLGVDLRPEQVEANEDQLGLADWRELPAWVAGDSAALENLLEPGEAFDLLFTCPPYGDLERYSDRPEDLSTMDADGFREAHQAIIAAAAGRLRPDRFAVWVMSDIRDSRGAYRSLVAETVAGFEAAGCLYLNEAILLDNLTTASIRAERPFRATRKLTRVHQKMLVFVKGDPKRAAGRLEARDEPASPGTGEPEEAGRF